MRIIKVLVLVLGMCHWGLSIAAPNEARFVVGVDPSTGHPNRCGIGFEAVDIAQYLAFQGSITVQKFNNPVRFMLSTKGRLIGFVKNDVEAIPLKHWWFRAPNQQATTRIGPIIPADDASFKLAGLEFKTGLDTLMSILGGELITIGVEPETGGSGNIRVTFTTPPGTYERLLDCLDELTK